MITTVMRFYPAEEEFPDLILCPLCKNQKRCGIIGEKSCKTIMAMIDDMTFTPGGCLK